MDAKRLRVGDIEMAHEEAGSAPSCGPTCGALVPEALRATRLLRRLLVIAATLPLLVCAGGEVDAEARDEVLWLTGGVHTRVAWREGGHPINGGGAAIRGFDSETGEVHTIWDRPCIKAVLAAGGHTVLVTSGDYHVWALDWDGSNRRRIAKGSVSDGWRDPVSGEDWAIYRASGKGTDGGVFRVSLADPKRKVRVWAGPEGHKVYPWLQISADGKRAASFFPYDKGGILDVEAGKVTPVTDGCWSGMASDDSYHWFRLSGDHRTLATFRGTKRLSKATPVMPPIEGRQIYCPRAAEGPEHGGRYIALSAGYPEYNKNGPGVEIFLGRFDPGYTKIESWARVTHNDVPDQHPTAWVGVEAR